MTRTTRMRLALFGIASAVLLAAAPAARAQATAEGTTITNTATVSFTDANANTYGTQSASVSVKVGFKAGIDVSSAATATPSSPSTGNELNFTLLNGGNGTDTLTVATTAGTGITITGYKIGTTTYATLAALNAHLDTTGIARNSSVVITVVYTVASGRGGQTSALSLTATSDRDADTTNTARTDTSSTNVTPTVAAAVSVTPDNSAIDRVPNSATVTTYTESFTVTNNGNASDTYTLAASTDNPTMITGISITGGSTVTIAANGTATVSVTYSIAAATANGTTGQLTLSATSQNDGTKNDTGDYDIRATKAVLVIAKAAFRDNQTTAITNSTSDPVKPGEFIYYRITVTNNGNAEARTISVSDVLPSEVTYNSTSMDAAGWTLSHSSGTVTGTLTSLSAGASRFFWIRVAIK